MKLNSVQKQQISKRGENKLVERSENMVWRARDGMIFTV